MSFWAIYFTEHPIEWARFEANPAFGISKSTDRPIEFCSHRDRMFYTNYSIERMQIEPSGIAVEAVNALSTQINALNTFVHGARAMRLVKLMPPFDGLNEVQLRELAAAVRAVFSNAAVLVAAFRRQRFDGLTANQRHWFNWLVGAKLSKRIRSGQFGMPT